MDSTALNPLLEQLDSSLEDLQEAIQQYVGDSAACQAKSLTPIERAKLYATIPYAIESLLFSYLQLHGVKARDHAVFQELTRTKSYFAKITKAETGEAEKATAALSLDINAANRFITAALAGNDRFDAERVKELGARKSRAHIRFDELGQPISPAVENTSVPGVASADIEYLGVTKPLTERRLKRQERRDERQKVKDMKKSANAAKRARRGEVAQPNQSAEGVPFEEAKDVQMDG